MAQAETSAQYHPARQARQLGDTPPGHAFAAIARHASSVWPDFEAAAGKKTLGLELGREIGRLLSTTRFLVADRLIDSQRAYRGTLLGLQHGLDCGRVLRRVAEHMGERGLMTWCDEALSRRAELVDLAETELEWFADFPEVALRSIASV